jgi:hypothetical protein
VYGQFTQLARTVTADFTATPTPRAHLFRQWLTSEEDRGKAEFSTRREGIRTDCLFCKRPLSDEASRAVAYYFETSDGVSSGFLEDKCFSDVLISSIFNLGQGLSLDDPIRHMFKDATRNSSFVFKPVSTGSGTMVEFSRFDEKGKPLLSKLYPLHEYEVENLNEAGNRSGLYTLMAETFSGHVGQANNAFLLVHPVDPMLPEGILWEENYREFAKLKRRITEHMTN